jgi:hypothetical protein
MRDDYARHLDCASGKNAPGAWLAEPLNLAKHAARHSHMPPPKKASPTAAIHVFMGSDEPEVPELVTVPGPG